MIVIILFIYNHKYKYKKILTLIIGSIILFFISTTFFPQTKIIVQRLAMTSTTGEINTNGRDTVLWPVAIDMYNKNKLFGYGLNTFNDYFTKVGIWNKKWSANAHNTYIQLLGEVGIVGTIIFCTAFLIPLIHTISLIRRKKNILDERSKILLVFSLFIQFFWLLYGVSGNPLYNIGQLLIYTLAISITKEIKRITNLKKCGNI